MNRESTLVRRVAGSPEYVADVVRAARNTGRLVAMTEPRLLPDGRAYVDVTLTAPRPARRDGVRVSRLVAAAVATVWAAMLGVGVYAAITLANALARALPLIILGLVLVGVSAVLGRRRGLSGTWKVGR